MKAIVVLADTVNLRYLPAYGNKWVKTPNIDRFSKKASVFNNHWCGSAPCMPARREMFTGRYNFLERSWGAIEPFDYTLINALRHQGVYTTMYTDHYHYIETGGENYCQLFDTWECFRGQESDPLPGAINFERKDQPFYGKLTEEYQRNMKKFVEEEDFTTPKTFKKAVEWLEENKEEDNYLLWVEGFDPHEPYDTPNHYLEMYDDDYEGLDFMWPNYEPVNVPKDAITHIEKRYAATLTMMDHWFGKLLDQLDKNNSWEDTLIIFTTDHGFMLGEHGLMGKNYMAAYNEVFHIPMMVYHPEHSENNRYIDGLTQNIDLMPTVLDYFNHQGELPNKIHGKSLLPLLNGSQKEIRKGALYGYFGKNVNVTDGRYTYFRSAEREDNSPLNLYGSVMTSLWQFYGHDELANFDEIEMGRFLDWTAYPVYKVPNHLIISKDSVQTFCQRNKYNSENVLFDIKEDYAQQKPIKDEVLENSMVHLLKECMIEADAPKEQFERLGMS